MPSSLHFLPIQLWIMAKLWSFFFHYYLFLRTLRLILHHAHEIGCSGADWLLLSLPKLSCEILPLQQFLMTLQIFRIDVSSTPVRKLYLLSHTFQHFLCFFHKFLHLFFVLQFNKLLMSSCIFSLVSYCVYITFLFWRCIVEVREGELDEVEVELQFFEEGRL